jgi:flagellar M-ring protein FliF
MNNLFSSLISLWRQLGINQKVSLAVATLVVIGGMIAVSMWARRPDYQLLYAKLGDKDSSAIISSLQSQGIKYQVTAGGTAVMVPSDQVHKIRMDLASKGLPSGDGVGFEIFDKGQFGLSDFVQRTNYIRALQGELARTISQVQGVRAARVMIVQPENRLLLTEQASRPTASVFVDVGGGRLELDQVNAIRHLVANSVQGLVADQVAVVDNRGRVLSEELKQDPTLGTASSQMRYKQQVEDYLARKVESMLALVIGHGQAVVRVSAEIDTESTVQVQERYDPEGQVVRNQTSTEDVTNSSEQRAGGRDWGERECARAYRAGRQSGRAADFDDGAESENKTVTYEINRTTTNTTRTPGTIKNVTASVLIAPRLVPPAAGSPEGTAPTEQRRSAQELANLRQVVVNALGLRPAVGQSLDSIVTLQEVAFNLERPSATVDTIQQETRLQGWIEVGSRWAAVIGAVGAMLLFLRLLSRQKPEAVPIEVLTAPVENIAKPIQTSGLTPDMITQLVRQKPANVGTALRGWVGATENKT